jgi:hypothetical protein
MKEKNSITLLTKKPLPPPSVKAGHNKLACLQTSLMFVSNKSQTQ